MMASRLTREERAACLLRRKARGVARARDHLHPLHCIIGQHLWHKFAVSSNNAMDKIVRSLAQRHAVTTVPRDAFYNRPEDYPGPAVDYSKGHATFEVRDSAVVWKVPPLDVFGLDWRLGEGPPHAALSIARMGTALVGERIELVNFQDKTGTGSWVKYDVLNFDAVGKLIVSWKDRGKHCRAAMGGTHTVRRVGGEGVELVALAYEQVRLPNPAPSTQKNFDDSIRRIWKLIFDLQELMPYGDWETRHRAQELMLSAYFQVNDPDALPLSSWNWRPSGPDFMAPFFWRGPLDRATKTYLLMCYSLDTTPFQRGTFISASRWAQWTGAETIFSTFDGLCRSLVRAEVPPRKLNACCPCCGSMATGNPGGSMATLQLHHTSFSGIGGYVCWYCDKKFAILDKCGRLS
jgi:hypothetical protein